MSDDREMIICALVEEDLHPAPGSTKRICIECAKKVWVSAKSRERVAKGADLWCMRCADDHLANNEGQIMPGAGVILIANPRNTGHHNMKCYQCDMGVQVSDDFEQACEELLGAILTCVPCLMQMGMSPQALAEHPFIKPFFDRELT